MLKDIDSPERLKALTLGELETLSGEIRTELINTVSQCGGHLSSNLGIVELTIALHYVFDCPTDRFYFDVGHQCYVHKMLTGRLNRMNTLRKAGGLSGFPDPAESPCDCFVAGHASTAISAALGAARARDLHGKDHNVIAIVGDGALTGGMCYEALNDAGQSKTRLIVVLNDNEMSISRNVGALSHYLNGLRQSRGYRGFKRGVRRTLERMPHIGTPLFHCIEKLRDALKSLFIDGRFFEALGFAYIGPIDGHNLKQLIRILKRAKGDSRPLLIHVVTQKGRGYRPAEAHPERYHGVAPFYVESGVSRSTSSGLSNGEMAGQCLSTLAEEDPRICVVTAAMPDGTGMSSFARQQPTRFFDVGIAEEHAVTMAAGLAAEGMKPYVALYSTFLQRCYDQISIDVCRNHLPVTFLIDRAGFVGADGRTHQGLYDLSFLRTIPGMTIAVPRNVHMLELLIRFSKDYDGPLAIRYSKEALDETTTKGKIAVHPGVWELVKPGHDVLMVACGPTMCIAVEARDMLARANIDCAVVDAIFVKPIDEEMLARCARTARLVVTLEENDIAGGLGEAVAMALNTAGIAVPVLRFGADDAFIAQGSISQQRAACKMTVGEIVSRVQKQLEGNK